MYKIFFAYSKGKKQRLKLPVSIDVKAGMIKQASAGIYSWLPLGFRVLKKIEKILRMNR